MTSSVPSTLITRSVQSRSGCQRLDSSFGIETGTLTYMKLMALFLARINAKNLMRGHLKVELERVEVLGVFW